MTRSLLIRLSAIAFLAATGWTVWTQNPLAQQLSYKQVRDDLWVIEGTSNGAGDAGNIGVLVTAEGVILIDDRFAPDYPEVMSVVRKITQQPVRYVMNTHHHGDHTGGNAQMLNSAEIVIQENARRHMVDAQVPGIPRIAYSQQASVFLGGKEVRAIYMGRGHTDGDVLVYIPHDRAVHMGDLMAGTRGVTNPVMDYANGGSLKAFPETLTKALTLDVDIVIPGHGAVSDKAGLVAHRDKIAAVLKDAAAMVRAKTPTAQISQTLIDRFDFKPINLRAIDAIVAELRN